MHINRAKKQVCTDRNKKGWVEKMFLIGLRSFRKHKAQNAKMIQNVFPLWRWNPLHTGVHAIQCMTCFNIIRKNPHVESHGVPKTHTCPENLQTPRVFNLYVGKHATTISQIQKCCHTWYEIPQYFPITLNKNRQRPTQRRINEFLGCRHCLQQQGNHLRGVRSDVVSS